MGLILGAMGVWSFKPFYPVPVGAVTETDHNAALANYTLWLTAFTGFLALATFGLGWATAGLYRTAEEQIKISRASLEIGQKGWLFGYSATGDGDTDWKRVIDIHMYVRHYGPTPVIVTEYHMQFCADEPTGQLPTFTNVVAKPHITMAQGNQFLPPYTFKRKMSDRYAYGFIRYTDVFGNEAVTWFCEKMALGELSMPAGPVSWTGFKLIEKDGNGNTVLPFSIT
jgi:hypothetical protein